MLIREVLESEKEEYDRAVGHPLQSWNWGIFRQKMGLRVIRLGCFEKNHLVSGFQVSLHPLPYLPHSIGYFPRGFLPDKPTIESLKKLGQMEKCLFIKLEPNVIALTQTHNFLLNSGCRPGKPLFTKYTFQLDLTPGEETLLSQMKEKTRYNVRLAQKYGVTIQEDNSPQAFAAYLKLSQETTCRQHFYAHSEYYHRTMWEILQPAGIAHLLTATYKGKILVTWIVFLFNNVLYYPYGASSSEDRQVMASNLMMWEAMRWGKAHNAKMFDLWGALDPNPNPKDPWYGFHRFKEGYGAKLVEFVGTYDLVFNPYVYPIYNLADNLRWTYLKFRSYIPI